MKRLHRVHAGAVAILEAQIDRRGHVACAVRRAAHGVERVVQRSSSARRLAVRSVNGQRLPGDLVLDELLRLPVLIASSASGASS